MYIYICRYTYVYIYIYILTRLNCWQQRQAKRETRCNCKSKRARKAGNKGYGRRTTKKHRPFWQPLVIVNVGVRILGRPETTKQVHAPYLTTSHNNNNKAPAVLYQSADLRHSVELMVDSQSTLARVQSVGKLLKKLVWARTICG